MWVGVKGGSKIDTPFSGAENHEPSGFFSILSLKSVSGSQLHGVCIGWEWDKHSCSFQPFLLYRRFWRIR